MLINYLLYRLLEVYMHFPSLLHVIITSSILLLAILLLLQLSELSFGYLLQCFCPVALFHTVMNKLLLVPDHGLDSLWLLLLESHRDLMLCLLDHIFQTLDHLLHVGVVLHRVLDNRNSSRWRIFLYWSWDREDLWEVFKRGKCLLLLESRRREGHKHGDVRSLVHDWLEHGGCCHRYGILVPEMW